MLALVNELRSDNGLSPLQLNVNLNEACQVHSDDQATNNFIGHRGSDGSSFSDRVRRTDYEGFAFGENVAAGNSEVEKTFNQWKNSSGHRNNILNPNINEMGLGYAYNEKARYRHYWTQLFGKGDNILSIDSNVVSTKQSIQVYPNPVKDFLTIQLPPSLSRPSVFSIITVTGRLMKEIKLSGNQNSKTIDINDIPPGIYFLTHPNQKTIKIIKN